MANGRVVAICICPEAKGQMREVGSVRAIAGSGLEGDRYSTGNGSFNKGAKGRRQVTLINGLFFEGSGFTYTQSRRNIVTSGIELMWLIGKEFQIGEARMRGVKYCDPCNRPNKLSGNSRSFMETFFDRGGLVAEILQSGIVKVNDEVIPPPKGYSDG